MATSKNPYVGLERLAFDLWRTWTRSALIHQAGVPPTTLRRDSQSWRILPNVLKANWLNVAHAAIERGAKP